MIMKIIKDEVYHDNGKISYRAKRGVISKAHEYLYKRRRLHPDGYYWVYIGTCGKWDKNGKQQWVLNYNNKGEILK